MRRRLSAAVRVESIRNLSFSIAKALAFVTFSLSTLQGSLAQAKPWSTRDTNFELKCGVPLPDFTFDLHAGYTTGNAFLALLAATVAENWTEASIRKDLKAWGFSDTQLLGKFTLGSYGYITENDDVRILAFRGTHSIQEGLIDAAAMTQSYADIELSGRGHAGMKLNFKAFWPLVSKELQKRQAALPKPLLIVGHSLGGSIALLHAVRLKKAGFPIVGVYTAAEPRIGNTELMNEVDSLIGDRLYRLEHTVDPVPHLPPTPPNAETFARVFAKPESPAYRAVQDVVEDLNYAPLPGWTLELTPNGFRDKRGTPAELESEMNFLQAFDADVHKSDSLVDIAFELSKNVKAHIGDSYVCNFLSLLAQGHLPAIP